MTARDAPTFGAQQRLDRRVTRAELRELGTPSPGNCRLTRDADPRQLCHNILIAIDPERGLHNGSPSGNLFWIDSLDPRAGDRVVHVGCGVGYYTAIIAEAVGPTGSVPLTVDPSMSAGGYTLVMTRTGERWSARFTGAVVIYPCDGARDTTSGDALRELYKQPIVRDVQWLRRDPHEREATCAMHLDDYCLSTLPPDPLDVPR